MRTLNEKTINGDPDRSLAISKLREENAFTELDELDLDRYAQIMEERKDGKFADILQDIKNEQRSQWRDRLRKRREQLSKEDLFSLFTGEIVVAIFELVN